MQTQDYYQVLGVDKTADAKRIKDPYRELAFRFHPDRNQDPGAGERMKTINEAYAVLSDEEKRHRYDTLKDQYGSGAYSQFRNKYSEQDIFRGSDIHQVFEEMAKAFGVRGFEEIFKEFYGQGAHRFEFQRPGFSAHGFVFTGGFSKASGRGQEPLLGHLGRKMTRRLIEKVSGIQLPETGADLLGLIRLTPDQARDGGPYTYQHPQTAKKLVIKIPAGVHHGQRLRLPGMGQPGRGGGDPGNLYLEVRIKKPFLETTRGFFGRLWSMGRTPRSGPF